MGQDSLLESDFSIVRKFFAIQDTITMARAEKVYSDSKLLAVQTARPKVFKQWLADAREWETKTRNSIQ